MARLHGMGTELDFKKTHIDAIQSLVTRADDYHSKMESQTLGSRYPTLLQDLCKVKDVGGPLTRILAIFLQHFTNLAQWKDTQRALEDLRAEFPEQRLRDAFKLCPRFLLIEDAA